MRRYLPQFLFAVLVVGLLLIREAQSHQLAVIEETFVNWLAANTNGEHAAAPVMLVEINDNCLVDHPWPWSPLDYASFLDGALQFKARAAAIEPVLAWDEKKMTPAQSLKQPQFEQILHDRILRMPKIELGAQLGFPDDPDVLPAMQPMPVFRNVEGDTEAVPEFTVIDGEPGEDIRLMTALGFDNIPSSESTAQHAPLVFRYRGQIVPSFALEAMMLWYGALPDEVEVRLGSAIRLGNKLTIPVDSAGAMLVDWKQPYDRVGFDDLELAMDQAEQIKGGHPTAVDPARMNDRLMVLARTDAHSQSLLFPTGRMGSSGELFAAAIATAESNAFARPAGQLGSAAVLLLGCALAWVLHTRRKIITPPLILGFAAAYLLLCLSVFEAVRIALPLTPMLGLAIFIAFFRLMAPDPKRPGQG